MRRNSGFWLLVGIIGGGIFGYLFAGDKAVDEQRLASIIRAELRTLNNDRSYSGAQEVEWSAQSTGAGGSVDLGGLEFQRTLEELKNGQAELTAALRDIERRLGLDTEVKGAEDLGGTQNARYEAQTLLSNAVATGSWTAADEQRFYGVVKKLPPGERIEAIKKLSVAINTGQIKPQTHLGR